MLLLAIWTLTAAPDAVAAPGPVPVQVAPDQDRSYPGCPLLLEGQRHECVARLQRDLTAEHPEYDLPGTTLFGPATRTAVLDFQGRHDLPADGNVGAETADLLADLVPEETTSSDPTPTSSTDDSASDGRRPECSVPRPDPSEGARAEEDWAVDQYVHGCTDAGSNKAWFTTNFGNVSNSYYFSPAATRQFDSWLDGHRNLDSQTGIGSFALCASIKSLACEVLGVSASVMFNDVKNATEDAVERGSCLKVTDHAELWTTAEATAVDNKYCRTLQ
ncbi:peptidoglycan-binding domain-containing protein [Actinomycetospora sp. OC33-EN08]|uniref:Peptidoglycan-binding domain-containing protein n=1 Tax=Actinomycetospora aurantiaca TaxID=3129233 RepID=A0ABU8MGI2_9PSEU